MSEWKSRCVVHYRSKNVVKGFVDQFDPWKSAFHFYPVHVGMRTEVLISEIKALFFVKSFEGKSRHRPRPEALFKFPHPGRRVEVTLSDKEVLKGTIGRSGCSPYGFYLLPADEEENNHLVFIPNTAVRQIKRLQVLESDSFDTVHYLHVSEVPEPEAAYGAV